jgi:hypothetical protein
MKIRALAAAGLLIGLAARPVAAELLPTADVPAMVDASDLIVVGWATATQRRNPAGRSSDFIVSVARVLKGTHLARVGIRSNPSDLASGEVREGQFGIFFLRRANDGGGYSVVDSANPALPASPQADIHQPAEADPLSRVAAELARFFTFRPPFGANQYRYEIAAAALKTIPYNVVDEPLHSLLNINAALTRIWIDNCLISFGDADNLAQVTPLLLNPPAGISFSISMFANAMKGGVKSPSAIPVLAELLSSRNVEIRRAAAYALRDIATADVIGPLGVIALKDADEQVRYHAVSGLVEATGVADAPGLAAFHDRPQQLLDFWAHWLRTHARH